MNNIGGGGHILCHTESFLHHIILSLTLSRKSRQAWRNALLSENIDHSRFAQPGSE